MIKINLFPKRYCKYCVSYIEHAGFTKHIGYCKRLKYENKELKRLKSRARSYVVNQLRRKLSNDFNFKIGCSNIELKIHIESKFTSKMNWNNFNDYWTIDHIKPLRLFDLKNENEYYKAIHYTNLQPLTHIDNCRKGGKYVQLPNP